MADHVVEIEPVERDAELHTFITDLGETVGVPVRDGDGSILGVVTLDRVGQRSYPIETKAASVVESVTSAGVDDDILDVILALLDGPYRAIPILDGDTYVGIATERSVLLPDVVAEIDQPVKRIMNAPITTEPEATVGRIRSIMREEDIGRLPVVKKDRLVGIVEWTQLLDLGRPKKKATRGHIDRHGEQFQDDRVSVQALMDEAPHTVGRDTPLTQVAAGMRKRNVSYAIAVEDKRPVGIVTCQDLLELLGTEAPEEGVWVQISGVQDIEGIDRERMQDHVESQVQKVARIHGGAEFFYLHVKRYHEGGSQTKWSLRTRLMTPAGAFFSKSHGFELLDTVDEALERLERQVREDHERRVEGRKEGRRRPS